MRPFPLPKIELDKPRRLIMTFGAMRAFEEETDQSLLEGETWAALDADGFWTLLWVLLLDEQPDLTRDAVGELIGPGDLPWIVERLRLAYMQAMPQPTGATAEGDDANEDTDAPAASWEGLWATGTYDLHLTNEEFWRLTPREFAALVKRRDAKREWSDYRFGVIAATIAALVGADMKPSDFFNLGNQRLARSKPQTTEHMLAVVRILNAAYGGTVVET